MNFKVINKESSYDKVYLKLNSKKNTVIKLNDKEININKGKNLSSIIYQYRLLF